MRKFAFFAAAGIALPLTLAACGDGGTPAGGTAEGVSGPALRIVGSSTVYPFTTAIAETFTRNHPGASAPIVESTGTGGGIKLFCGGVGLDYPDIANASRRIKASEIEMCNRNGVEQILEIQVGLDGIVFAQSRDAEPMSLTAEQIYRALAATDPDGSPNTATNWSDIDPSLPDHRIEVLGPPPTSGTRDAFNELVMTAGCKEVPEVAELEETDEDAFKARCERLREDGAFVEAGENDNLIVQKLTTNPNAVGIFGYSYLEENLDKIEPVALNGVAPEYENIASGDYIAARPLYIYVKGEHMNAKPALETFVAEYIDDQATGPDGILRERGLIAAPEAVRSANAAALESRTGLTAADLGEE